MTRFLKTNQFVTFSISRNTDLKYWMCCCSLMVLYSYANLNYIANTSYNYLITPGFLGTYFFNCCNITDKVYRGWYGRCGWVGSRRQTKANIREQAAVMHVPSVGYPDRYNSQGRPDLPLKSIWHPMQSY